MFGPLLTDEIARALDQALRALTEVFEGLKLIVYADVSEVRALAHRACQRRDVRPTLVCHPPKTTAQDARVRAAVARAPARSEPPVCMAHGRWAPRRT